MAPRTAIIEARLDEELDRRRHALSAMESLTATTLHELVLPLSVVTWEIERLKRLNRSEGFDQDDAAIAGSLERLRHAVDQCTQIISRMQAVALAGKPTRSHVALDLIIRNALRTVEGSPGFDRLQLKIDTLEVSGTVHCDPVQTEQVLVNLLLNATAATRLQPSPRIRIRAASRASFAFGRFVELIVDDNGPGVPACDEADLFQPLPTGVGLAVCKSIVEAHGGFIWYERRRAPGACFHFTLPQAAT